VRARGLALRLQLEGMPTWARSSTSSSAYWTAPSTPAELSRWDTFVNAVTTRYGGPQTYLEIWNEPNNASFWAPAPNPTNYALLLAASYTTIKSVSPATTVLFGGLSESDVGYLRSVYRALRQEFGSAAAANNNFFDELNVHPYTDNRGPQVNSSYYVTQGSWGPVNCNFRGGLVAMDNVMHAFGDSKSIYIGEYGFTTEASQGSDPVSDATRAEYLRQAYVIAGKLPYVTAMSWYYLEQTPWNPASWTLLTLDDQPNDTYNALVSVAKHYQQSP
jgi:hypothetical protein